MAERGGAGWSYIIMSEQFPRILSSHFKYTGSSLVLISNTLVSLCSAFIDQSSEMNKLLLAPYNDSMRPGHGYNSFLHTPCVQKVVHVTPTDYTSQAGTVQPSTPQIVSYNSRHVKDLSDLVQSMNVSPASAIQLGSLKLLGHFTAVNEEVFKESDLNVVVSVSVSQAHTYPSMFF